MSVRTHTRHWRLLCALDVKALLLLPLDLDEGFLLRRGRAVTSHVKIQQNFVIAHFQDWGKLLIQSKSIQLLSFL